MIQLTIYMRRSEGMTHEEFIHYHQHRHVPLFHALPEVKSHLRRYKQIYLSGIDLPGVALSAYDAIVKMWFTDEAAVEKVFGSAAYEEVILPAEAQFLDFSNCSVTIGESVENEYQ